MHNTPPRPIVNDLKQGISEARFLALKSFAIRLGFLVAAMPLLVFLLPSDLRSALGPSTISGNLCASLVTVTYPLALLTNQPRKYLPTILYGGTSLVLAMGIWTFSQIPDGYSSFMWLLLYPLFLTPMLAMPFDLRANAAGVGVLMLLPSALFASGMAPGFPLTRFYIMVIPAILATTYFKFLLDGIISNNHIYLKRIEALAQRDGLTGSFNRRFFMEETGRLLKLTQRSKLPSSLIMIDIDHFKRVNDRYGHAAGDQVIREAVRVLESTLRETDLVARIGGEEFTAFLFNDSSESSFSAAERVRTNIEKTKVLAQGIEAPISFTISLGISHSRVDGDSVEALLDRADKALYVAKQGGRNQVAREQ